jgi:hypothetical protein
MIMVRYIVFLYMVVLRVFECGIWSTSNLENDVVLLLVYAKQIKSVPWHSSR